MNSIFDRINAGEFKNRLPYPDYISRKDKEKQAECQAQLAAYRVEEGRLTELFRQALLKEYGVESNPKAARCFEIAWEDGHSAGFSEVASCFHTIVELIK